MAGTTITMSRLKQIIRHREDGMALQTISKILGIARNTVKKYLQLIESRGFSHSELLKMEDEELNALLAEPGHTSAARFLDLEAFFPYMLEELKETGVNRWNLWGEYKTKHSDGYSYSQFCEHFRQWCSCRKASMHMDHIPGDKLFIDYAGDRFSIVDAVTGEINEVETYVSTLGYSQYTYVEAVPSQKKEDFISASDNALHFYGGVPKALVPDNLKSAVTKADRYEPLINSDFLDFANHYGCTVFPARSRKPQDKSLVEKTVSIVYARIYAPLRNRVFHDLPSLNRAIMELLLVHNSAPFQRRPVSRKELFETEEKASMKPLAMERYELKEYKQATVPKFSHIHLKQDKHYYSVPFRFIGKKVKIAYSQNHVSVYYSSERIAYHKRNTRGSKYTTIKEHMPSSHRFVSDWNPDFFLKWAKGVDPDVHHYVRMILDSYTYPEQAYKSCLGILGYERKVGRERLINAVRRATGYDIFNYSVITRILRSGLDTLPPQEEQITQQEIKHDNIRGSENYK